MLRRVLDVEDGGSLDLLPHGRIIIVTSGILTGFGSVATLI